jgi:hypothetical protein
LIGTMSAKAQNADTLKMHHWRMHDAAGAAEIQVTYRNNNLNQLNQVLNNNGIPSLGHNDVWINAAMSHIVHHWVMENGIGFTPVTTAENNNIKAKYNQYQAYLRMGYDVSKNAETRLYPFVGLNFSAAVLRIQDDGRIQNTADFSQELLNNTASKTFYQPNFGIELGAGFDYLIKLKAKKMERFTIERNIPIGIRAGYYINAAQGDWKIDNYKLQNGPDKKQGAFFVSLNIGLGFKVKK